jgi:hypothetical protein
MDEKQVHPLLLHEMLMAGLQLFLHEMLMVTLRLLLH